MTSNPSIARPFDVYLDRDQVQWLDSMEGVPAFDPRAAASEQFLDYGWQKSHNTSRDLTVELHRASAVDD